MGITPFVTSKGYLGLASGRVSLQDRVHLFPGAHSPFWVRQRKGGKFQLMGNIYVHGIMYGEAMNGAEQALSWIELC